MVVPSFNTRDLTLRCVDSVLTYTTGITVEVIAVDNGSDDGTVQALRARASTVVVQANPVNIGFARAANQGLGLARAPYVALLNSDAYLRDDALTAMVQFAERESRVAAVGARLVNADGSHQPSAGCEPRLTLEVSDQCLRPFTWLPRAWRSNCVVATDFREPVDVDWVAASCVLLRRDAVLAVGGFDEQFTFGEEDIDLCTRLRHAAWRVVYFPGASVVHLGGQSRSFNPEAPEQFFAGRYRWYLKHRGRRSARRYRRVILASLGLRWAASVLAAAFGTREWASRADAYARLWTSIRAL